MKKRKIGICIFALYMGLFAIQTRTIYADNTEDVRQNEDTFIALDEEGNLSLIPEEEVETPNEEEIESLQQTEYQVVQEVDGEKEVIETADTKEEAEDIVNQMKRYRSTKKDVSVVANVRSNPTYGVVIFKSGGTTDYVNADTGISGYIAGSYSPDAAYLGKSGNKVKFRLAGVTGLVDESKVNVIDYDAFVAQGNITSVYTTSQGKLYHKITTNLTSYASTNLVGYQQGYMSNNATYYSYDGHYFYTNYKTMISDYVSNSHSRAINPSAPYYNYYQFLSHRSTVNYTAAQIDQYINANTDSSSKLRNLGQTFINHQNTYGVNAMLMLGVSINESGWGTSKIAREKNNLFGHGAADSNPYWGANGYATPGDSIKYHAEKFVSNGYLDVVDWRYFGPHLGDKESGMNVKYASDPYWGEKAAARGYYVEDYFGGNKTDYGKYVTGVASGNVSIYQNPNKNVELYSTGNGNGVKTNDVAILVLGTVTGTSINGSNIWYKVQTDTPLNANRTSFARDALYNFGRDYGYMHSSTVTLTGTLLSRAGLTVRNDNIVTGFKYGTQQNAFSSVNDIKNRINSVENGSFISVKNASGITINSGYVTTGYILTVRENGQEKSYTIVVKGEVNSDFKVTSSDFGYIKNHIMGGKQLTGAALQAADVNNDGKITSSDFGYIRNYIMGTGSISQ